MNRHRSLTASVARGLSGTGDRPSLKKALETSGLSRVVRDLGRGAPLGRALLRASHALEGSEVDPRLETLATQLWFHLAGDSRDGIQELLESLVPQDGNRWFRCLARTTMASEEDVLYSRQIRSAVVALAIDEGSGVLFVLGDSGTLVSFDLHSGEGRGTAQGFHRATALAAGGGRVVSADRSGLICVWGPPWNAPQPLARCQQRAGVESLALSRDGRRLFCGLEDGRIGLCEDLQLASWRWTAIQEDHGPVRVSTDSNGKVAFCAWREGAIACWRMPWPSSLEVEELGDAATASALSADGSTSLTSSPRGPLELRKPSGAAVRAIEAREVRAVCISTSGALVAASLGDGTCAAWDGRTGAGLRHGRAHDGAISDLLYTGDPPTLVTASLDGGVTTWRHEPGDGATTTAAGPAVTQVAVSGRGRELLASSTDGRLVLKRIEPAESRRVLVDQARSKPLAKTLFAVSLGDDHRAAVASDLDGTVWLWRPRGGQTAEPLTGQARGPTPVALASNGAAALSGDSQGVVRWWVFPEGGRASAVRMEGEVDAPVSAVGIGMDDRLGLATVSSRSGGSEVFMWDLPDRRMVRRSELPGTILCAAVARQAPLALAGDRSGALHLLDGAASPATSIAAHQGPVRCVAVSPDATFAVSAGDDRRLIAWSVRERQAIAVFKAEARIVSASISRDNLVVTSDAVGRLCLFELASG
jgi:WD40 repeat protein